MWKEILRALKGRDLRSQQGQLLLPESNREFDWSYMQKGCRSARQITRSMDFGVIDCALGRHLPTASRYAQRSSQPGLP